jgi:predicted small lipoprotein YifL
MSFDSRCLAAAFAVLLFSTGCGQRGPLFLPGDPNEGRAEIPSREAGEEAPDDDEQEPAVEPPR